MNCECIYYRKGATIEELRKVADRIKKNGECVEIAPCAISTIDKKTECCANYDGYGETVTIPAGSLVLFAVGKYRHMLPLLIENKRYKALFPFPVREIKFTDIETFEGE